MSFAAAAFMYAAIATSGGALAFLTGQRTSGRTPPEVEGCHEQARLLEATAREIRSLAEDAAKAGAPADAREELEEVHAELEDAILELRRGADRVV